MVNNLVVIPTGTPVEIRVFDGKTGAKISAETEPFVSFESLNNRLLRASEGSIVHMTTGEKSVSFLVVGKGLYQPYLFVPSKAEEPAAAPSTIKPDSAGEEGEIIIKQRMRGRKKPLDVIAESAKDGLAPALGLLGRVQDIVDDVNDAFNDVDSIRVRLKGSKSTSKKDKKAEIALTQRLSLLPQ